VSNDHSEKKHSNDELRAHATALRRLFGVDGQEFIDVLACLKSGWLLTISGKMKRLVLEILTDDQMGSKDATADSGKDYAIIRCKASVAARAEARRGRDRMTLAHELAHIALDHTQMVEARETGASAATRSNIFRPFESAESMADKLAAFFLIKRELAQKYKTAKEISDKFGVSLSAAQVCASQIERDTKNPNIIRGFAAILEELNKGRKITKSVIESAKVETFKVREITVTIQRSGAICIRCHGKIHPIGGNRFECEDCGIVDNHLQDGDSYGT
jgi:Zn-dependent peptidase ImmA (M78 family)